MSKPTALPEKTRRVLDPRGLPWNVYTPNNEELDGQLAAAPDGTIFLLKLDSSLGRAVVLPTIWCAGDLPPGIRILAISPA